MNGNPTIWDGGKKGEFSAVHREKFMFQGRILLFFQVLCLNSAINSPFEYVADQHQQQGAGSRLLSGVSIISLFC